MNTTGRLQDGGEREDPVARQQKNNLRLTLRGLVVLYLVWLIYQLVRGYRNGDSGMSLPMVIAVVCGFGGGAAAIAVLSYRRWKREGRRIAQLFAEQEAEDAAQDAGADSAEWTEDGGDTL